MFISCGQYFLGMEVDSSPLRYIGSNGSIIEFKYFHNPLDTRGLKRDYLYIYDCPRDQEIIANLIMRTSQFIFARGSQNQD
jgi:hypothetical protein